MFNNFSKDPLIPFIATVVSFSEQKEQVEQNDTKMTSIRHDGTCDRKRQDTSIDKATRSMLGGEKVTAYLLKKHTYRRHMTSLGLHRELYSFSQLVLLMLLFIQFLDKAAGSTSSGNYHHFQLLNINIQYITFENFLCVS